MSKNNGGCEYVNCNFMFGDKFGATPSRPNGREMMFFRFSGSGSRPLLVICEYCVANGHVNPWGFTKHQVYPPTTPTAKANTLKLPDIDVDCRCPIKELTSRGHLDTCGWRKS